MQAETMPGDRRPIGILDSGVGGLSVLREVRTQLPHESIIYLADQANVPYGPRSIEEVRAFTVGVSRFLIAQGVKLIVVACNTASAAALYPLREMFPALPFVGMEPAVKPAAHDSQSGVIGVIATEATFQGTLYASVVGRFAQDIRVETAACPALVRLVEAGETDTPAAYDTVKACLAPLLAAGIDQLVLGCTHFPFLSDPLQAAIGPGVRLVDPSPAVARQVGRVLGERGALRQGRAPGQVVYYTSGDVELFRQTLRTLLGYDAARDADVRAASWTADGRLAARE